MTTSPCPSETPSAPRCSGATSATPRSPTAARKDLRRPVISRGHFGYKNVNVLDQRRDPDSLLHWMETMLRTLRECPEFGTGTAESVNLGVRSVLAVSYEAPTGTMLALTNLADEPVVAQASAAATGHAVEVFADSDYGPVGDGLEAVELTGFGYRWIRTGWEIPSHPPPPQLAE